MKWKVGRGGGWGMGGGWEELGRKNEGEGGG